ncbi:Di-copper centre-containing protein [Mycena olivaceomarginata]|nr:Di-copper centre-containing protein [Mycena olivaceomarginata]
MTPWRPTVNPPDIGPVNISGSYYDDFVYVHMIHFTGLFLPWHRWYVHVYEGALKSKCNFRGVSPYWDWTKDASNVYESTLLKDASPVHGLGGWGDPNNDYRVPDGAFSSSSSFRLSYPSPHTIRRNFTLQPYMKLSSPRLHHRPAPRSQCDVHKRRDRQAHKRFYLFRGVQRGSHGGVHNIVGGDLGGTCPDTAPPGCVGGPHFLQMVPNIWFDWQHKHPANARAFQGGAVEALENVTIFNIFPTGQAPFLDLNSTMPSDGLFPEVKISDVISTTDGILCYIYE